MSPLGISSTLFSLFNSSKPNSANSSNSTLPSAQLNSSVSASSGADFSSSLAVRMASLQAQSVNALIGSVFGDSKTSSVFDILGGSLSGSDSSSASFNALTGTSGLSASGRNISLRDPESAYAMMSLINTQDITYKAQFAELSAMKSGVAQMQTAGQQLAGTNATMSNEAISGKLQAFVEQYNAWSQRFEGDVQRDGLLQGTQAAEVSLNELEQSVSNILNGAQYGIHGLEDLGITIDHASNSASFNPQTLNAALATNKEGVVNTINQFSSSFAKSAELLASNNNFIANRLSNLDRVIDYIGDNKSSLQSEFGLGDPARISPQVAKALAAYNQTMRI